MSAPGRRSGSPARRRTARRPRCRPPTASGAAAAAALPAVREGAAIEFRAGSLIPAASVPPHAPWTRSPFQPHFGTTAGAASRSVRRRDSWSTAPLPSRPGTPVRDDALEDDGRPVGDGQRGPGELLDQQDREPARRQLADLVVELADHDRRQTHGELVEQQDLRSVAKARASASICCSPPDSVPAICLRRPLSCGNCAKATSSMRSIGTPTCVAMRRFSRTLRLGKIPAPLGHGADAPAGPIVRRRSW